ncbi:FtsX-like permease family protein [Apibacter muscae]|uniref:FtsX-like permease family protein n=1 Tax=Apibacter muscae TaxID=2509004 RepID=A0A563D8G4_9FLAO|nr:ABC transporter permease [Apibacter muscae]TWP22832.1 FtsX-like permease family protein [Apibacter muscae]TWP26558.1 FtsX-like permease family protein [Apibacter muscae]TWP28132.1 FtsX-like permease family protein [Apibacter muscae]
MNLSNLFKISFRAILLNKMRTLLTMLGIIIGVASVIAMLAIGEGSKQSIKDSLSSMGSNIITIRPGAGRQGGVRLDMSASQTLTLKDLNFLSKNANLITEISPVVNGSGQSIHGANNWPTTLYGVTPEYLSIRNLEILDGSMFTTQEVNSYSKVCILGKTVIDNLFPNGENPIGQIIRFNKIPLKVIGTLSPKGENAFGQDQDNIILAPFTTIQKRVLAITYLNSIVASAVSEEQASNAVDQLTTLMRESHQLNSSDPDNFNISSQQEILSTMNSTSEMLTILLVAIASISLLVGGIGIMNIMYVSVKERTREIGLRMAVGAKGKDILMQFLIESILISFTGGAIGVLIGLISTYSIKTFAGWPVSITLFSIFISFAVCTVTGIFFGWYPAKKASDLDPIDALRYE